jgi:hypothetical protein
VAILVRLVQAPSQPRDIEVQEQGARQFRESWESLGGERLVVLRTPGLAPLARSGNYTSTDAEKTRGGGEDACPAGECKVPNLIREYHGAESAVVYMTSGIPTIIEPKTERADVDPRKRERVRM